MAIYHFSGTVISRSQGRSAVACAAYRSGQELQDERYGKTHDYTQKQDIAFDEILLPEKSPDSFKDRQKLWNAVEAFENRKDAQLAREFNFSLPRELTLDQQIALSKEFVQSAFVDKGMIADLCIHNDRMKNGELQTHAHVMLTMREVTADGFGKKVREWNAKENLLQWREQWAMTANQHLLLHGRDIKIDHRTLEAQGIDLEPQYKIGSTIAKEKMANLEDHQRIARENGEKLLENPGIALHAITHQQSTFTNQDLARFVARHTIDADQFQNVFEKVKASDLILSLGVDAKQNERFTTKEMLNIETRMLENASTLSQKNSHEIQSTQPQKPLTTEQKTVFDHITQSNDLSYVVGFAGTGKSYMLGALKESYEAQGFNVLGATISGIAAENLTGSSGIESRTLASRFYYWEKGEQLLTNRDILVIDEAGMIGSRVMDKILDQAKTQGAKVVLIGDPEQLQAIEAGAAFRSIANHTGYVELSNIFRQKIEWQKEATRELATGKTESALKKYEVHDHIHAFDTKSDAQNGLINLWNDARIANVDQTQIMLSYTRNNVRELNDKARELRHQNKELGADNIISTVNGDRSFAISDRLYFLKNDRQLGVMNGTLGTITAINDKKITIKLDTENKKSVSINLDHYNHIDHGYAATIHKAQGVTVDRTYILASKHMDRHATYVAASRHRESADIFYGKDEFANTQALTKTLSRERVKDVTLDYLNLRDNPAEQTNIQKTENTIEAKLRAFTQSTRAIMDSKNTTHTIDPIKGKASLENFKKQFEAKNPTLANELRQNVMTSTEKSAQASMAEFKKLEAMVEKGDRTSHLAKSHLETLAGKIASQKEVMQYVREHDTVMEKQVQKLSKEINRERDFEMER